MRELQINEINAIAGGVGMGAFEIIMASSIVVMTVATLITDCIWISELKRSNDMLEAATAAVTTTSNQ
jgi:hypothetical protein